jgi:hypothetical protein
MKLCMAEGGNEVKQEIIEKLTRECEELRGEIERVLISNSVSGQQESLEPHAGCTPPEASSTGEIKEVLSPFSAAEINPKVDIRQATPSRDQTKSNVGSPVSVRAAEPMMAPRKRMRRGKFT